MTAFGEYLRLELKSAGFTRERFAEEMDIHPTTIQLWMTGKRNPRKSSLEKVAGILNCDLNHLLSFFPEM